jgi:DNA methyltransferase 1-associated protein 1
MGDVAEILGSAHAKVAALSAKSRPPPPPPPPPPASSYVPSRAQKMTGISKEVMELLGGTQDTKSASLPPIVPSFRDGITVKVGNKTISSTKSARKWTWAAFASSSRTDGAIFRHWVRAGVEYTDYPYAKFDIHLDPVTYTEDEYQRYLKNDTWTKSETDKLMEVARRYELRWAVIQDRWFDFYYSQDESSPSNRTLEELQHRYYSVAAILAQTRISHEAAAEVQALSAAIPDSADDSSKLGATVTESLLMETAAARALAAAKPQQQPLMNMLGTGSSNKTFDIVHERERRAHMDLLWRRSKEEEIEETELRKELRVVEAQLRKLKKTGGHIIAGAAGANTAGAGAGGILSSAPSSRNPSRSVTPVPGAGIVDGPPALLDQCFASTAPTPMAQTPYLQSGRLVPPATGGPVGLNKTLLNRMDTVLTELKIPKRPIPTKRVCDMYDTLRKDVLTLLTLQKMLLQKEGNLQAKRLKLAKMVGGGGSRVMDEEALLGIAAAPAPAPSASPTSTSTPASRGKGTSTGKRKSVSSGSKPKAPALKKPDDSNKATDLTPAPAGIKKKTTTKRKRKPETSKSPTAPAAVLSTAPSAAALAIAAAAAAASAPPIKAAVATPTSKQAVMDTTVVGEAKVTTAKKRVRKL